MNVVPVTLDGRFVRLEPIEERHRAGLRAVADDTAVWQYSPVDDAGGPFDRWLDVWFDRSLAVHSNSAPRREVVFVVRRKKDDRIVGSTRYLNIEPAHHRLEIGSTWYAADARGTHVNPECKLLLMTHAFDALGAYRVELKCDARNVTSRAAIAKLGAKEEGTLRRHMALGDGFVRDTVYFSVLDREWQGVRDGLVRRVQAV